MYAYHKNKKLGWIITFVLFLTSVIIAFVLIVANDWRYPIPNPKFAPQPEFMDKFYYKPYVRASAYMMGIFSGFVYVEWKNNNEAFVKVINKIKNSLAIRIAFYVIGIALVEFIIWIIVPYQQGGEWSTTTQAFYNSLNRYPDEYLGCSLFWESIYAALVRCSAANTTPPNIYSAIGSSPPSPKYPSVCISPILLSSSMVLLRHGWTSSGKLKLHST